MVTEGSDCVRGKTQFVSKQAAVAAATAARARHGGPRMVPFKCLFCGCWHLGNRRGANSKSRGRR